MFGIPLWPLPLEYETKSKSFYDWRKGESASVPRYLTFQGPDSSTIWVEIEPNVRDVERTGVSDVVSAASSSLRDALAVIRTCSEALIEQIAGVAHNVSDMEMKFGVKASAELGHFVVAKASAEANFEVTLKWNLQREPKPQEYKADVTS
jgi:hypothetical protein